MPSRPSAGWSAAWVTRLPTRSGGAGTSGSPARRRAICTRWRRVLGRRSSRGRRRGRPGRRRSAETRSLGDMIREIGPDLVHLHSSKAGLCGRLALRGRLPTVFQPQAWSFHAAGGAVGWAAAAWERRGARWAHALVCASETERADGERAGIKAAWRVIYNGVDVERLSAVGEEEQRDARERLGLRRRPARGLRRTSLPPEGPGRPARRLAVRAGSSPRRAAVAGRERRGPRGASRVVR